MLLGSVMYREESKIMSGSPASFFFHPSSIPHTMHLSYPSFAPIFSQTKHISNKPSLTLWVVTIHQLFLKPSICTNQAIITHILHFISITYLPFIRPNILIPYTSSSTAVIFHTQYSSIPFHPRPVCVFTVSTVIPLQSPVRSGASCMHWCTGLFSIVLCTRSVQGIILFLVAG